MKWNREEHHDDDDDDQDDDDDDQQGVDKSGGKADKKGQQRRVLVYRLSADLQQPSVNLEPFLSPLTAILNLTHFNFI